MLATLADTPADAAAWAYETKWDGVRALVYVDDGRVRITSRNHNDITLQFPELVELGTLLRGRSAVLDGEIVALDDRGHASFQRMQQRMGLKRTDTIAARAAAVPATLMVFDVLHLDGAWTVDLPFHQRRELLVGLPLRGHHVDISTATVGDPAEMLERTRELGLEGVMAKRTDSRYRQGQRTGEWRKIKHVRRQEFVVCGYTEGAGARAGSIGALLLGYHDRRPDAVAPGERQQLVYAGSVGTGFNRATLARLQELLEPLRRATSPYDVGSPGTQKPVGKWQAMRGRTGAAQAVTYVEPRLVAEIGYAEFTNDGTLRQARFKGLRDDKAPEDVVREDRAAPPADGKGGDG